MCQSTHLFTLKGSVQYLKKIEFVQTNFIMCVFIEAWGYSLTLKQNLGGSVSLRCSLRYKKNKLVSDFSIKILARNPPIPQLTGQPWVLAKHYLIWVGHLECKSCKVIIFAGPLAGGKLHRLMSLDVVKWVTAADGLPRRKKKKTKQLWHGCSFSLTSLIEPCHTITGALRSGHRELACLCG